MAQARQFIVLTRDRSGNRRWAAGLGRHGLATFQAPMIKIVPATLTPEISGVLNQLASFDWLVFTSARGVGVLESLTRTTGILLDTAPPVAVVGPATAAAARRAGFNVQFVAEPATAASLAAALTPIAGRRLLLARTSLASPEFAANLRTRGATVTELVVYHTHPLNQPNSALEQVIQDNQIRCFTFASTSAITGLTQSLNETSLNQARNLPAITLGAATAAAARTAGFHCIIQAPVPSIQGIVETMKDLKTSRSLAGDEHWPTMPTVTVPGDTTAPAMPPGATQPEGEHVVQNWQRVAVLEVVPAAEVYLGFMAGDHMQFMNVPVELQQGRFGVRVGNGEVKFFIIPTDLRTRLQLKLVKITTAVDPDFAELPLY
jgi:uroporphyrinogen-III synthase